MAPVTALSTVWHGQAAISVIASGPASSFGGRCGGSGPGRSAAARSASPTAPAALSSATATTSAPNSTAWAASRSGFPPPAARPATRNRSGLRRMTSAAWVPMDPVEPRMTISRGPACAASIPPLSWMRGEPGNRTGPAPHSACYTVTGTRCGSQSGRSGMLEAPPGASRTHSTWCSWIWLRSKPSRDPAMYSRQTRPVPDPTSATASS